MRARHRNSGGSCKLPGEVGSPHKRGGSVHPKHLSGEGKAPPHRADRKARGGVLTAKARQHLPRASFALPGKGIGPKGAGSGSYPIPDKSHARNALARVSQHGSSEQKAKVRAAVHRKFPSIGEK